MEEAPKESISLLSDIELKEVEKNAAKNKSAQIYSRFTKYSTFKVGDILLRYYGINKEPDTYSNTGQVKRYKVVHVTPDGLVYIKTFCSTGELSKKIVCISDVFTIGNHRYEQDADVIDSVFLNEEEYSPAKKLKDSLEKLRKLRKLNYPNRIIFRGWTDHAQFHNFIQKLKVGSSLFRIDDKFEEAEELTVISRKKELLVVKNRWNEDLELTIRDFNVYSTSFLFYKRPITRLDLENGRTENK